VKALIIILVLVGASFLALITYGQVRDDNREGECARLPEPDKDGKVDVPDDWCPPDVAKRMTHATRGLQARFTKGLGIDPVELKTSVSLGGKFLVPASDKKARGAKLTLTKGDWAIVQARHDDKTDQVCLCRPGSAMPSQLFASGCDEDWKKDHQPGGTSKPGVCQPHDDRGLLPFENEGGLLEVLPGAPATVKVE
jgi:hypothetical protein